MHPSSISCHFTTKVVNVPSQDIKNFNYGYGEPTKRLSSGLVMARRRDAGNDIVQTAMPFPAFRFVLWASSIARGKSNAPMKL